MRLLVPNSICAKEDRNGPPKSFLQPSPDAAMLGIPHPSYACHNV